MVKKRVVVAMSGGVDSSVAALLLNNLGYEVIGLTMCFGLERGGIGKRPVCCGFEASRDAKKVADFLGIKHYNLNFANVLNGKVIKKFIGEYAKGRTPNPCVDCNREIKFGELFKKALKLGAEYLATGHYVRICRDKGTNKYFIRAAKDSFKDQSYFLYDIDKKVLPKILFPLGELTKQEVRAIASKFKLPVADKPASQEICFLGGKDYRTFLETRMLKPGAKAGIIEDLRGNILGRHKGIAFYTIGQRAGLGIAHKEPLYVLRINPKNNKIIVGVRSEAYSKGLIAKGVRFSVRLAEGQTLEFKAKIRYNHTPGLAKVKLINRSIVSVSFKKPQFAVTPGQAVVFYKNGAVIGGGTIEKSF